MRMPLLVNLKQIVYEVEANRLLLLLIPPLFWLDNIFKLYFFFIIQDENLNNPKHMEADDHIPRYYNQAKSNLVLQYSHQFCHNKRQNFHGIVREG
jgi:hypothetical protein